jgi:uncharacterized protein (TIGR02266 family)
VTERRSHRRIPIEMWVEEQKGKETYYQRAANLSLGGIFLPGTIPHPEGTVTQLKLALPDGGAPLEVRGEVRAGEAETVGMRIRFVELTDEQTARLRSFLGRAPEDA